MPQQPTIANTLGAMLIGLAVSSIITGISSLQAYTYYQRFPRDDLFFKSVIGCLTLLNVLHLTLILHAVWFYVIVNFGNPLGLSQIVWSFKLLVPMNVAIVLSVQALYIYRVYVLGAFHLKWKKPVLICCIISFMTTSSFGLGNVIKTYEVLTFRGTVSYDWAITGSFVCSTISDIVVALAMCYYLRMSRTSNSSLNSRLSEMVTYTVNSGLLTGVWSLVTVLVRMAQPVTMVYIAIGLLHPNLYVFSYLAMLNSRNPNIAVADQSADWSRDEDLPHPMSRRKTSAAVPPRVVECYLNRFSGEKSTAQLEAMDHSISTLSNSRRISA